MHETEVSALYDGGNNVGMLAMYHAAKATIAKAEAHGIAVVGVTNSWMSGRSAYFVEMIANAGSCRDPHREQRRAPSRRMAAIKPVLGTNPIAFAMPTEDGPLILDMGTSAFMATELHCACGSTAAARGRGDRQRRQSDPRPGRGAGRRAVAVRAEL